MTQSRKRLLTAMITVATVFGLACEPQGRASRKQTSIEGSGMVAVPSVIGVAQDRALDALAAQNLEGAVIRTEETCRKPAGTVVSQDPAGMTQAETGSTVDLVIAQRTPIELPDSAPGLIVLGPGDGHSTPGREGRSSRVEFMLAGDPCAAGTVVVAHPTAGPEVYELETGERGDRSIVYGPGQVTIEFKSLNKDARLVVETD